MKTLFTLLLTGMLMVSASVKVVASGLKVSIIESSKKEINMYAKNISGGRVHIQFMDKNQYELLDVEYEADYSFAKKVNLKNLPGGVYSLKVSDNDEVVIIPVKVNFQEATAMLSNLEKYEKLNLSPNGSLISINFNNQSKMPEKILIFDSKGQLLHKETYKGAKSNKQTFDFSKMGNDTYKFEVHYGNLKYSEFVLLD